MNVLWIVWDAARYDYTQEYAPFLTSLADKNISFERAISPSGWSLPSHISMFTGKRPTEHGHWRMDENIETAPLPHQLGNKGYTTYGISANGFLSHRQGFDKFFDDFRGLNPGILFPKAFNPLEVVEGGESVSKIAPQEILNRVAESDEKVKSLINISTSGLFYIMSNSMLSKYITHPWFSDYLSFNYNKHRLDNTLSNIISEESFTDTPFFIYTNFFSTHHPYAPKEKYQREVTGRSFSQSELETLAELSHPLEFLDREYSGTGVEEEEIRKIRKLYAAEIRSSDESLRKAIKQLKNLNLYDDTLVVVTADHGENLGEKGPLGDRMMGHDRSASDNQLHVPLVIANPRLNSETIRSPFNTRHLYNILSSPVPFINNQKKMVQEYTDSFVISETPVQGVSDVFKTQYPNIPEKIVYRDLVVGYSDRWKVILGSQDDSVALKQGKQRPIANAPSKLVKKCRNQLEKIISESANNYGINNTAKDRLQKLGYL